MVECPKCLGTGELFIHSRLKKCNLCDGHKQVEEELAEDFIESIHPFPNE
jgi:DnaJ-class molecular chaperone